MLPTHSQEVILSNMRKASSLPLGILKSLYPGPTGTQWTKALWWHVPRRRPTNWLRTLLWWRPGSSRCSQSICHRCRIGPTVCNTFVKIFRVFLVIKLTLSWMTLIIVWLISLVCKFITFLNTDLSTCPSNILDLIPHIDKGFALMLAQT
jgi:hypothetical protein